MENLYLVTYNLDYSYLVGTNALCRLIIADNIETAKKKAKKEWNDNIKNDNVILDHMIVSKPIT